MTRALRAFSRGEHGRSRLRPYIVALACVVGTSPAAAQAPLPPTTPRFVEVTRLAQEGYGDSARAVIARILSQTRATDAAFPEALYTSAAVAKTLGEARLQYARISVEHAQSPWADKATLRLAQLDYGSGNTESAVLRVRRIFTDFPESAVIPVAALFGARAAFERREGPLACDWLTRGLQQVGSDLELKNQLEYAKQRCTPEELARLAAIPKSDSLKRPEVMPPKTPVTTPPATTTAPPSAPTTSGKATTSPWRVQVAAISDPTSIRRATQQIEAAGYMVYRVAGPNGLTKLQAGPFSTREAAVAAVGKLKAAVGGAPFVVKAP